MSVSQSVKASQPKLGLIGGLGVIAGADILQRIIRATPDTSDGQHIDISFVQHPFQEAVKPFDPQYAATSRKLYVYEMARQMELDARDLALVPCFLSQTFLDEIIPEVGLRIIGIGEAIGDYLSRQVPMNVGVLTSPFVRGSGYLDRLLAPDHQILYPEQAHEKALVQAIYGPEGLKSGHSSPEAQVAIINACTHLMSRGADVILSGFTDIPAQMSSLFEEHSFRVLNCNQIFAEYAAGVSRGGGTMPFKVGVVGGVGPAATVDFVSRIVQNTHAQCDQDHIKVVVEQNPQIPDRTENLSGDGKDPTVALYATCKKLERAGANIIAIPCNTAHAYLDRIQRHVDILIVSMLSETIATIQDTYPVASKIGLLATNGTVQSRLYHKSAEAVGLKLITPEPDYQAQVMDAIYGDEGVKAGHTEGHCREQLFAACQHLSERGADVLILGCTELPLIAPGTNSGLPPMLDPTDILARKCVTLALTQRANSFSNTERSSTHV
ncbi:amino acid racemase [uncultured Ruegeria sp.]|uniref:aspartate/glutamate racemase family protein n=1 Tax=uncultured Ruegeria sp. TaxID=259304 RepID=UPI002627F808|nr:amino acid racemase [uncultured Ruegeria sp.]